MLSKYQWVEDLPPVIDDVEKLPEETSIFLDSCCSPSLWWIWNFLRWALGCHQWHPHWPSLEDNFPGHFRPHQTGGPGQSIKCPCRWDGCVDCSNQWRSQTPTEHPHEKTGSWNGFSSQHKGHKNVENLCTCQNTSIIDKMWEIKLLDDQNVKLHMTLWTPQLTYVIKPTKSSCCSIQ